MFAAGKFVVRECVYRQVSDRNTVLRMVCDRSINRWHGPTAKAAAPLGLGAAAVCLTRIRTCPCCSDRSVHQRKSLAPSFTRSFEVSGILSPSLHCTRELVHKQMCLRADPRLGLLDQVVGHFLPQWQATAYTVRHSLQACRHFAAQTADILRLGCGWLRLIGYMYRFHCRDSLMWIGEWTSKLRRIQCQEWRHRQR